MGQGIIIANHNQPLPPFNPTTHVWLTTHGVIVHAHVTSIESFKAKVRREGWENHHYISAIQGHKENNHFDFFLSPTPIPLTKQVWFRRPTRPSTTTMTIHTTWKNLVVVNNNHYNTTIFVVPNNLSKVIYTRGGVGCGSHASGLLSLLLFNLEKDIISYNNPHNHLAPLTPSTYLFCTVNNPWAHAHVASLKNFKAKVQGESLGGNHFNSTIKGQQG